MSSTNKAFSDIKSEGGIPLNLATLRSAAAVAEWAWPDASASDVMALAFQGNRELPHILEMNRRRGGWGGVTFTTHNGDNTMLSPVAHIPTTQHNKFWKHCIRLTDIEKQLISDNQTLAAASNRTQAVAQLVPYAANNWWAYLGIDMDKTYRNLAIEPIMSALYTVLAYQPNNQAPAWDPVSAHNTVIETFNNASHVLPSHALGVNTYTIVIKSITESTLHWALAFVPLWLRNTLNRLNVIVTEDPNRSFMSMNVNVQLNIPQAEQEAFVAWVMDQISAYPKQDIDWLWFYWGEPACETLGQCGCRWPQYHWADALIAVLGARSTNTRWRLGSEWIATEYWAAYWAASYFNVAFNRRILEANGVNPLVYDPDEHPLYLGYLFSAPTMPNAVQFCIAVPYEILSLFIDGFKLSYLTDTRTVCYWRDAGGAPVTHELITNLKADDAEVSFPAFPSTARPRAFLDMDQGVTVLPANMVPWGWAFNYNPWSYPVARTPIQARAKTTTGKYITNCVSPDWANLRITTNQTDAVDYTPVEEVGWFLM